MAKIKFTKLGAKVETSVATITFNEQEIEVKKYLPQSDKYDLIMIALQNSKEEDGSYNPIKLDMYFHLYLVFLYTNIEFTEKQKEDLSKLYDTIKSSGLLDEILKVVTEEEYEELLNYIAAIAENNTAYNRSFAAVFKEFVEGLVPNAEKLLSITENLDPETVTRMSKLAKTLNGGRDI